MQQEHHILDTLRQKSLIYTTSAISRSPSHEEVLSLYEEVQGELLAALTMIPLPPTPFSL